MDGVAPPGTDVLAAVILIPLQPVLLLDDDVDDEDDGTAAADDDEDDDASFLAACLPLRAAIIDYSTNDW